MVTAWLIHGIQQHAARRQQHQRQCRKQWQQARQQTWKIKATMNEYEALH